VFSENQKSEKEGQFTRGKMKLFASEESHGCNLSDFAQRALIESDPVSGVSFVSSRFLYWAANVSHVATKISKS